jgi:FtsP/CotA-like multicopper oxidase with cupredoxin domain
MPVPRAQYGPPSEPAVLESLAMSNPRVSGTRRLLQELLAAAGVAAAITVGLAGPGIVQGAPGPAAPGAERATPADTPRARIRPVATRDYSDSLREPALVRSVNGVLTATLVVDTATLPVDTTVGGGRDTASAKMLLRSFQLTSTTDPAYRSGLPLAPAFPGPTFRVQHGDLVRIRLINSLPQGGPQDANDACIQPQPDSVDAPITIPDVFQACFHGPNYTNIHYHGMHVTPDSTSTMVGDDVLMAIAPGDTLQYSFRIPRNQSPGTHWYHPHKHGSVAIQVANGMAGAFIVEDTTTGLDSIVRALQMREHLIAIQQVAERIGLLGHQGELDHSPVLANGQYQPTIYMAPGEVQRWRIVNENTTRTTKTFEIGFQDLPGQGEPLLYDVARDGVQFAPVNYDTRDADTSLFMAPGQRLDVFVKAPLTPGLHYFRAVHNGGASRATRGAARPGRDLAPDVDLIAATQPPGTVLFKVFVDTALSGNTTLPASLPQQLPFLSGELAMQSTNALILFTDSLNQQPSQFYLGSRWNPFQRYDDHSVFVPSDTTGTAMPMVLEQTQTWKIVNNSQQLINHPFHIHINPFQVNRIVYPQGKDDPFSEMYEQLNAAAAAGHPIWLDVLPLPLPLSDTTITRTVTGVDSVTVDGRLVRVDSTVQVDTVINGIPNTAYAVITQKYDDFEGCPNGSCGPPTGQFVMHCHILGHEERGMMQVLQVNPVGPPRGRAGGGHGAHQPAGAGSGEQQAAQPGHRH